MALGDRLFHDPRLSHNNTLSCNSCHDTATNGAEAGQGKSGAVAAPTFNTPTVFNAALNFRLNWEGDLRTLEGDVEQALRNPGNYAGLRRIRASRGFATSRCPAGSGRAVPRLRSSQRLHGADRLSLIVDATIKVSVEVQYEDRDFCVMGSSARAGFSSILCFG